MGVNGDRETPPWSIREARADDYDAIAELWLASGLPARIRGRDCREAFVRQRARAPALHLVAIAGERVIGVVLGSHDGRKGWINRLAVVPEHRRRGIAAALVRACEKAIRAEGIEIVAALVEPASRASGALFEELGYREDVPVRYFRKLSRPDA